MRASEARSSTARAVEASSKGVSHIEDARDKRAAATSSTAVRGRVHRAQLASRAMPAKATPRRGRRQRAKNRSSAPMAAHRGAVKPARSLPITALRHEGATASATTLRSASTAMRGAAAASAAAAAARAPRRARARAADARAARGRRRGRGRCASVGTDFAARRFGVGLALADDVGRAELAARPSAATRRVSVRPGVGAAAGRRVPAAAPRRDRSRHRDTHAYAAWSAARADGARARGALAAGRRPRRRRAARAVAPPVPHRHR